MSARRTQLILLDVMDGVLFVERTAVAGNYARPALRLPLLERATPPSGDRIDAKTALRAIRRLRKQVEWSRAEIVVGIESDPLNPFEGKFDVMVKCLEEIAVDPPASITIQTRSPLIVLALPLLKRLQDRLRVVIAVEAINDSIHRQFSPFLPRPSERISAARTLHRFGIHTQLQIAPIVGGRSELRQLPRRALSTFLEACDTAASVIEIVALPTVISGEVSQQIVATRLGGELQKVAHLALRELCRTELKRAELVVTSEMGSMAAA